MSKRGSQPHTHLIGIGGIGMSALAQVLAARGARLSGCDLQSSPLTAKLARLGIAFSEGHSPDHLIGAERVIVSDAIRPDNPELLRARELGLPVQRRSQAVGELMRRQRGIAVAGTHGKTTTCAMTALILDQASADPTVLLGGELPQFGGNARSGCGKWLVVEACEAYESFLDLEPEIALITNIEAEHLDHHGTEQALIQSFARFITRVRPGGRVIICADDPNAASLADRAQVSVTTYGTDQRADWRASEVRDDGMGMRFCVTHQGEALNVRLAVPGRHNVLNATAAIAASAAVGVAARQAAATLARYRGVERRFQVTRAAGVTIVDDYAHHPTEIRAVIRAARPRCAGRLVVVFQPHLYSRTRDFLDQFAAALSLADQVVVTEVYPAREQPIAGVTGSSIVTVMRRRGKKEADFVAQKHNVVAALMPVLKSGDWVLVLGAGDIGSVAAQLARALRRSRRGVRLQGAAQ